MKYATLYDLLRQSNINTENQLMDFYDYSWQYCPYTGISIGGYIIFYKCGTIDHGTHVLVPVAQSDAESDYNATCTEGRVLAYFRMLSHEFLNKDPYIVPE